MKTAPSASDELVDTFRTFGPIGPLYQVLRKVDDGTVRILVVESGEELDYPIAEAVKDPEAE